MRKAAEAKAGRNTNLSESDPLSFLSPPNVQRPKPAHYKTIENKCICSLLFPLALNTSAWTSVSFRRHLLGGDELVTTVIYQSLTGVTGYVALCRVLVLITWLRLSHWCGGTFKQGLCLTVPPSVWGIITLVLINTGRVQF